MFLYFLVWKDMGRNDWTIYSTIIKGLEIFTTAVPPILPLCMTIGIEFSTARLRKKKIFCINPTKVNVAGRVKVCCFDKTGTLTEDSLRLTG
jgi:cation-transporting ATPase 13A2